MSKNKDCGKFLGTPVVVTPQRHKINSTEFVLSDDILTIVAGDDRPIKVNVTQSLVA